MSGKVQKRDAATVVFCKSCIVFVYEFARGQILFPTLVTCPIYISTEQMYTTRSGASNYNTVNLICCSSCSLDSSPLWATDLLMVGEAKSSAVQIRL